MYERTNLRIATNTRPTRNNNAGFLDKSGDLGAPGATRCYASDIANRLIGLTTSPRTCDLDE